MTRPTIQAVFARLRHASLLATVALTSATLFFLSFPGGASASATGALAINTKGLPGGQWTPVTVSGHGRHQVVRVAASRSLRLPAGHYTLQVRPVPIARAVRGVRAGAVAYPFRHKLTATVKTGSRAVVTVGYGVVNPATASLPSDVLGFRGRPEDPSAVLLPSSRMPPRVGTILVSASTRQLPRGLISKVTRIRRRGSKLVASLVAVPVTDAVPSINFEGGLDFHPAPGGPAAGSNPPARASSSCSSPKLLKFGAHLDSFELRRASIGIWPPQMNLTLAVRSTESMGLAAVAAGVNCDWSLAELGPYEAAIPVGPVVIPVYATIPVKAGVHIDGKLEAATINVASTTVADTAAGFDSNHVSLTQQGSNVWTSGVFSVSGSAKLYASVGIEAGIGVAKGANVHVSAGFGPEFEWSSGHSCSVYADLGSLSAGVTVLGKSLNTPRWTPIRPQLWSGCAPGGSAPGHGGGGGGKGGSPGGPGPVGPASGASDQIALAGYHSCAVTNAGHVACWGQGYDGQLGDGSHSQELTPVEVLGIDDAKAVTAGASRSGNGDYYRGFSCALLATGHVDCWGDNEYGELGNGTTYLENPNSSIPVPVSGITNAVAISASDGHGEVGNSARPGHACALLAGGGVKCWGANESGQLGDGSHTSSPVPVTVKGISNATKIVSGGQGNCALLSDHSVDCWGEVNTGYTGREIRSTEGVPAGFTGIMSMAGGDTSWCGSTSAGPIECWGDMQENVPCSGSPTMSCGGSAVGGFYWPAHYEPSALAVSASHACGIATSGSVECWGYNEFGQLGHGPLSESGFSTAPGPVGGLGAVKAIAVGYDESCAAAATGQLYCWGRNNHGQLGNGTEVDSTAPVQVAPLP